MKKIYLVIPLILLVSGCSSLDEKTLNTRKDGIIDACYTVIEYNSSDKKERINTYLDNKIKEDTLTTNEKYIIEKCIERTEKSKCWSVTK